MPVASPRRRTRPLGACAAAVAVALSLGGCALKPPPKGDEIRAQALPNLKAPAAWTGGPAPPGAVGDRWLATFNDPALDALVAEALAYNTDLMLAASRVEQAAGYAKLAGASIYPAVNLLARGGGKMGGDGSGLSGVGVFANWELDLWGRARSAGEAGSQQYQSAVLDAEYARQSIAALTCKSWLLAIEARMQLAIARDVVKASEKTLELARDRARVGNGSEYEVALAQANLDTFRDAARQLTLAQTQAVRALEVLAGRYPAAALDVPAALPGKPVAVPVGLPSDLLERRPDIVAAERRVAAAFNRVEEAKAARLPKIGLTVSATTISSSLFVLKDHSDIVGSAGASFLAPLFSGYALEANVDIRTAEQKQAIAEYGRTAAKAFADVESALSAEFAADEREAILASAAANNARALELAEVRYRVGSGDLRAVLQQNVALYAARTALIRVQTERLVQRVNLYVALGGSFEAPPAPVPTAAAK